ncbi:MAG: hypothetical protein M1575_04330 [Patescibacteria group bacterium]|nr:hypothetical protein [Patescibacteria group bacterium]
MKKIFLPFLFLLLFVYPKNTFAMTVANRSDGTFLLDGKPYFLIGFSPQSLVYNVTSSDWQDLKNSGVNFTNDGNNPYRFAELNTKLKANGINVAIISYGPGHSTLDATAQSNLAKNESNFLGYYGFDEPTITKGYYDDYRSLSPERELYYQTIFQNDPNHFIWTNHFQYDDTWNPSWENYKNPPPTFPMLVNYNIPSRSSVTGTDVYDNWVKVGYLSGVHKKVAKDVALELQKLRSGINGGVIMIIPGYSQATYDNRLNSAIDAVIHGANGVVFYFDNADWKIQEWTRDPKNWDKFLPWLTDEVWTKWKTLSAYTEIKQVSSILNSAYPGLTGTINSSITANLPILAKNGTDNKLYLFLANESANDIQASIQGIPANSSFYEIISKRTVSSSQLSSFIFPKYSTQIYVQGIPSVTATPTPPSCIVQGYKTLMPGNANTEPAKSQTITINGTGGGTFTNNPYIVNNVANGSHTVSASVPQNYKVGYTLCYNRIDCHNDQPVINSSVEVNCNEGYVDLWWHYYKKIDIVDLRNFLTNFLKPLTIFDYNKMVENFGE